MTTGADIDGVLVQWGDRLFYPGNRIVEVVAAASAHGSIGSALRRSASASRRPSSGARRR